MASHWTETEIAYLRNLAGTCERLATRFNQILASTKSYQNRLKIPLIVLSSVAGVASFGSNGWPGSQMPISVAVGATNLIVAILNSIDSLFGFTEIVQKSQKVALEFSKLRENIEMELSLPMDKRSSSADVYLRNAYQEYISILESAPMVLKNLRFISTDLDKARSEVESIARGVGIDCFGFLKSKRVGNDYVLSPQVSVAVQTETV